MGTGLGGGIWGVVYTLLGNGTDLYVGGDFSTAGGVPASKIAQWDGSAWSGLGSGVNELSTSVRALALAGGDLYVGGSFTLIGSKTSRFLARAQLPNGVIDPPVCLRISGNVGGSEMILRIADLSGKTFIIEEMLNLTGRWTPLGVAVEVSPGNYEFVDSEASKFSRRFYRAID